MNAIGYIRISTKDQSKYSLDVQADSIREYCRRNGLELLNIFRDNGECSDTFDRADFLALEDFIKKHKGSVRYLIIMDHDRFSRDLAEALLKIKQFEKKFHIKVLSIDEPLDLDINDPDVFLQRAFKYLMANQELLKIRKRTKGGIYNAMAAGRFVQKAPLGYKNARGESGKGIIIVDETKAHLIQKIFELYMAGIPYYLINDEVKKLGYQLKANGAIQAVLSNCVYAGLIKVPAFEKNPERYVKGLHQALISEEDFWKVQEMMGKMKAVKRKQPAEDVPLRGILKCWCGNNLTSGWSKGKLKYYLYYLCPKHRNVSLSGQKLHEQFKEVLRNLSLNEKQISYIREAAKEKMKDNLEKRKIGLDAKNKELLEVERQIDQLEQKLLEDKIEPSTYKKWYPKYTQKKAEILAELSRIKKNTKDIWDRLADKLDLLLNLEGLYEQLPVIGKHQLINAVFNQGLTYLDGSYRTPNLTPALLHNELIMKEKGLLLIEQPSMVWRQIPLSSPEQNRTAIKCLGNIYSIR